MQININGGLKNKELRKPLMEEPFIIWNDKYNTGIESIDREHRNLVEIINRFHADLNSRRIDKEETFRIAAHNLMNYVKEHLAMRKNGCLKQSIPITTFSMRRISIL